MSPSAISDYNQEFQVRANLSINANDGTVYYLRGVFYKEGTSDYCGFTWNGSSWFQGPYSTNDNFKNFLAVTVSSSSAETVLKAKLDPEDKKCTSSGTYHFKVQRFTQSGSGTFDDQNELAITITLPTYTPSPPSTTKPKPTQKPSPTQRPAPTSKPSLTGSKPQPTEPGKQNTVLPVVLSSPTVSPLLGRKTGEVQFLATTASFIENIEPSSVQEASSISHFVASPSAVAGWNSRYLAAGLFTLGGGFLSAASYFSFRHIQKNQRQ